MSFPDSPHPRGDAAAAIPAPAPAPEGFTGLARDFPGPLELPPRTAPEMLAMPSSGPGQPPPGQSLPGIQPATPPGPDHTPQPMVPADTAFRLQSLADALSRPVPAATSGPVAGPAPARRAPAARPSPPGMDSAGFSLSALADQLNQRFSQADGPFSHADGRDGEAPDLLAAPGLSSDFSGGLGKGMDPPLESASIIPATPAPAPSPAPTLTLTSSQTPAQPAAPVSAPGPTPARAKAAAITTPAPGSALTPAPAPVPPASKPGLAALLPSLGLKPPPPAVPAARVGQASGLAKMIPLPPPAIARQGDVFFMESAAGDSAHRTDPKPDSTPELKADPHPHPDPVMDLMDAIDLMEPTDPGDPMDLMDSAPRGFSGVPQAHFPAPPAPYSTLGTPFQAVPAPAAQTPDRTTTPALPHPHAPLPPPLPAGLRLAVAPAAAAPDAGLGLILGGTGLILLGIYLACQLPLQWLAMTTADDWSRQKTAAALLLHAVAALTALGLGTGSIFQRRWAPPLIHAAGWVAALTATGIIAVTGFYLVRAEPEAGLPAGPTLAVLLSALLIPLAYIFYYEHHTTIAACEAADPSPSWTDDLPVPALMVFLTGLGLASGAAAMLCHQPSLPLPQDRWLDGTAATAAWAGLSVLGLVIAVCTVFRKAAAVWLLLAAAVVLAVTVSPAALAGAEGWEVFLTKLGRPPHAAHGPPLVPLLAALLPAPLLLIFAMARRAFPSPPLS